MASKQMVVFYSLFRSFLCQGTFLRCGLSNYPVTCASVVAWVSFLSSFELGGDVGGFSDLWFDAYTADAEGEGDWDLFDFTGGPDLDHCASIRVSNDHLREVYSTASHSLSKSVVYLIGLALRNVPTLPNRSVDYTLVGAPEATMATPNEHIDALGRKLRLKMRKCCKRETDWQLTGAFSKYGSWCG